MANDELVMLVNRTNKPIKIAYDKVEFMLPPKAKTKREFIKSKLSEINPVEVTIVR